MKAVGNNPLERYVGPGDGRRHRPQRRVTPPTKISSTGTPGEPIHLAQDHLRTGLDFDLIGWSERGESGTGKPALGAPISRRGYGCSAAGGGGASDRRKATNGWVRTNSRTRASSRRSPQAR